MNFESGTTEAWTWANPYHIVELQSDLLKIGDLLNLFYPFYFTSNQLSNFIFIPVIWANNLFQGWSKDPKYDAVDTNRANTNIDQAGGRLSCPSKATAGRKKALILVVNKPDWFEPGELTYLGYDNDFSEIPMIESDCIRFDVDYSDTNRKFADGTAYNGTIQGAKKILKFGGTNVTRNTTSGWYECRSSGTATLSFPKKYLLKVVTEPAINFISQGQKLQSGGRWNNWGCINWDGKQFLMNSMKSVIASSSDGINWSCKNADIPAEATNLTYGNGMWINGNYDDHYIRCISRDSGATWSKYTAPYVSDVIAYGNGIFMELGRAKGIAYISADGINWSKSGSFANIQTSWNRALGYVNGKWMAITWSGKVVVSYDNGATWSLLNGGNGSPGAVTKSVSPYYASEWYGVNYFAGRYWVMHRYGSILSSRDGINWRLEALLPNFIYRGLGFNGDRIVTKTYEGIVYTAELNCTIQFPNIASNSDSCTTSNSYTITDRKEFFIEADQINEGSDGNYKLSMNLNNIRLISAEITNRPYQKVTPTCALTGTISGSGTAYISTNVKKPVTIQVTPSGSGTITFYDNNKIEDNVGTHTITVPTTFTFRGWNLNIGNLYSGNDNRSSNGINFTHNLSKYKVRYSITNAQITSTTLKKQLIRNYAANYNRDGISQKPLIMNNGKIALYKYANNAYWPLPRGSYSSARSEFFLTMDSCLVLTSGYMYIYSTWGDIKTKGQYTVYGLQPTFRFLGSSYAATISHNGMSKNISHFDVIEFTNAATSNDKIVIEIPNENVLNQFFIESKQDKSLLNTTIDTTGSQDTNIEQNKGIALQRLSSNLSDQIVAGDYICFQGDGELTVTVSPISSSGTLTHTIPSGSNVTATFNEDQAITIDPDNYKYEQNSDGTYTIQLTTNNLTLSDLKMVDADKTCVYTKIRMPRMCGCVDFTQKTSSNGHYYYIAGQETTALPNNYFYFSDTKNALSLIGERWDADNSRWYLYCNYSNNTAASHIHFISPMARGDMFWLLDDDSYSLPQGKSYFALCKQPGRDSLYIGSSTHRISLPFNRVFYKTNTVIPQYCFAGEMYILDSNVTLPMIMGGVTLPINTMLYCGASGNNIRAYRWQSDGSGNWNGNDATTGVKSVTVEALKKLYADWSSDIRIYVILYRKQTQYAHPVTKATTDFDYSYITNLAANSTVSGTAAASPAKPIFKCLDVADETALNSTLDGIAADIKSWAGYEKAKNVE